MDVSNDADFWNTIINDDMTIAQNVTDSVLELCKQALLIDYFCKEFGLSITDETALNDLDAIMEEVINDFGGEDLLAIELSEYGITIDQMRAYYEQEAKIKLLEEYWYGELGSRRIPSSDVEESYFDSYIKIDAMTFIFVDSETNSIIIDETITDEESRAYFDEHYVKVQHILYMTVDTNGEPLSEEEIELAEQNANESFDAITSGEATFEEKKEDNEDSGSEYVFTYGKMVDEFEEASFEMEPGEVRLVETEFGYHIIKKFETNDDDFESKLDDVKQSLSKERMTEKVNDLYDRLVSGEAEFVEGDEDDYFFTEGQLLTKGGLEQELEDLLFDMEPGEIVKHEIIESNTTVGYYIFQRNELEQSDLEIKYSAVEQGLIEEAFASYLRTFYDSITVNMDEYNKFNIISTVSFPSYQY
jgi:parvulin-like peptidyl-prolyl isomerase